MASGTGRKALAAVLALLLLAAAAWLLRSGARDSGVQGPPAPPAARPSPSMEGGVPGPATPAPATPAAGTTAQEASAPAEAFAVRGRVVNASGEHVGDAAVWSGGPLPDRRESPVVLSDAEGRYEIRLPKGSQVVRARALHTATASVEVAVEGGAAPAEARDLVLGEGGVIRGKVVDGEGRPLPWVRVRCWAEDDESFADTLVRGKRFLSGGDDVVTEADGTFALRGLEAAGHRVYVDLTMASEGLKADPEHVEGVLPGGEPLLFRVSGETTIRGVVLDGETGDPVRNFTVGGKHRVMAADGRFEFPGKAGEPLEVAAGGYLPFRKDGLGLREGEKAEGITVRLEPDPGAGSLVFAATGEGGAPVPGLTAQGMGPEFQFWTEEWEKPGTGFRVRRLVAGKHTLFLSVPGFAPVSREVEVPAGAEARAEVSFVRAGRVRLRVLDAKGNVVVHPKEALLRDARDAGPPVRFDYARPQGTAFVITYMFWFGGPGGTGMGLSECDGTLSGLPAGTYRLRVNDGARAKEVSFEVAAGEERELVVKMGE